MRRIVLASLAIVSLVPTISIPAIAKDNRADDRGRQVGHAAPHHQFKRGEKFDRRQASNYQAIDYRTNKRLKAPPRGYQWVRSGNDALLVSSRDKVISSIIAGVYR
jgi:Ni/Co efflux regulator RcnB